MVMKFGITWIGGVFRAGCVCISVFRKVWYFIMVMVRSILGVFSGLFWLIRLDSEAIWWVTS
jgi:hypothetical protein